MLLLGIDVGTSSIKITVADAEKQQPVISVQYPETEYPIHSPHPGWAEQDPELWWEQVQAAIKKANASGLYNSKDIAAIGISYQMHGLVLINNLQQTLRKSIIWCDSRAAETGEKAFAELGSNYCLTHLLNSPGNFTAAKLAWVKSFEPEIYQQVHQFMLPGDFIAMKLTGEVTTTPSALSEGIFWDFVNHSISEPLLEYFGFEKQFFPPVKPVFSNHGFLRKSHAENLGLKPGIPVTYKAGDQLNNALSLNVLHPGDVAATAGTSGVIYGVSSTLKYDPESRVNTFAHINHTVENPRLGVLLCINGTGILNRWAKEITAPNETYHQLNYLAAQAPPGSEGLRVLPFGNGAERMLNNKMVGAHYANIDLNIHNRTHFFRASQEGVAFAFRYGLDFMRENGMNPKIIRAGSANMFLSPVFTETLANVTGVEIELYNTNGSFGAALGAGIGAGIFRKPEDAFGLNKSLQKISPSSLSSRYEEYYQEWKQLLLKHKNM
ncbi:MAG TPA: FGGY family carbohydrate kinase [Parasegetibacter sp.]